MQVDEKLQSTFENSIEDVDRKLGNILVILAQLSCNRDTLTLGSASNSDYDDVKRLKDYEKLQLYGCTMANNMIKSISIYYNENNCVINEKGKFDYDYYFSNYFKNNGVRNDVFKKILKKGNDTAIIIPQNTDDSADVQDPKPVVEVLSFPLLDENPIGSVIITLDKKFLLGTSSNNSYQGYENFLISNGNGEIIASMNNNIISKQNILKIIGSNNSFSKKIQINNKYLTLLCKKSNIMDLWYIQYIPFEETESSIINFEKVMTQIIIGYITLGLLASLFFSIFNYSPIRVIINEISKKSRHNLCDNDTDSRKINEYDIIKVYINDLCNEKENLNSKISIYMNDIKNNFFRELITDGCSKEKFSQMSELFNLNFKFDSFCFACIVMDDAMYENIDQVNRTFHVQDMIDELLTEHGANSKINLDKGKIGIIINVGSDVTMEQIIKTYQDMAEDLNKNYNTKLKIGLGNIYEGHKLLPLSYCEACESAEYCVFYDLNVISYKEVERNAKNKYYYPVNIENKLFNCIEVGDYYSVKSLLSDIFTKNYLDNRLTVKSALALYYDLIGTLNKVIEKYHIDISNFQSKEKDMFFDGKDFYNLNDMVQHIHSLYETICDYDKQSRENSTVSIAKNIIKFINKSYCDSELSCSYVADKFNISQPYLSIILKKYVGMNYGDYVNSLRIKAAKILLKEKDISINEIAVKVGYGSGNSFMRTFKNIEGVTPRQYSNSIIDQEPNIKEDTING
jgi:AraC-type DNA-binding domain-containing proteins